jgi:2-polyprenyl-3-methyl-5-hydroxy-6-metoxy-1,4-benzoquinol methylase
MPCLGGDCMSAEKKDFDKEAASWDEHPTRVKLASDVADAITRHITLTPDMDVLDFGCGTGLLSLRLQPLVRSITGVDSSRGMLDVLEAKVARQKLANVRTLRLDLDEGDVLTGSYDAIVSSMTLHHVREIEPLLARFSDVAAPGGYLCIADLDLDGGLFHDSDVGVFHFGFDRAKLRGAFEEAGFGDVLDATAAEVVKKAADGQTRRFTVFLLWGRKRAKA